MPILTKIFLTCCALISITLLSYSNFGGGDLVQYWSATKLIFGEGSAYNPDLMLALQQEAGRRSSYPIMLYAPPQTSFFFLPAIFLDFTEFRYLYLIINALLIILTSLSWMIIFKEEQSEKTSPALAMLGAVAFCPNLLCLSIGQVSIILGTIVSLAVLAMQKKRYTLAGILFSLLFIKAHLFLILGFFLYYWIIRDKNYKIILGGLLGVFLQFLAIAAIAPDALIDWADSLSLSMESSKAIGVVNWRSASLADALAFVFGWEDNGKWRIAVPALAGLSYLAIVTITRPKSLAAGLTLLSLAISLTFAPYGWIFDCAILAGIPLLVLYRAPFPILFLFFALQPLTMLLLRFYFKNHHELFWFAPLITIMTFYIYRYPKKREAALS